MSDILTIVSNLPKVEFEPGEEVLTEGSKSGRMYFLVNGLVAIVRSGVQVAEVSDPGAVFGEMALLLDAPHTATVKALVRTRFHVVENGAGLLRENAEVSAYIAAVLARRLDSLNRYLISLKRRGASEDDPAGLVDDMLDALINQEPEARDYRARTDSDPF